MSPAKSRKSKAPKRAAKAKPTKRPAKRAKARPARPAKAAAPHTRCAASDPFGDPCQNLPRRPSKYCVIHSYLER